jgi:hypothetical protein
MNFRASNLYFLRNHRGRELEMEKEKGSQWGGFVFLILMEKISDT